MNKYSDEEEKLIIKFYQNSDEASKRRYVAIESKKIGHGGKKYIKELLGTSYVSSALRRGGTIKSIEHMAEKVSRTKTKTGISVSVFFDKNEYKTGRKYSEGFKVNNKIVFDEYLLNWNYTAKANP